MTEITELIWPRIVYHLTDGTKKSEKGITPKYTYDICATSDRFKLLEKKGWTLTPDELYEPRNDQLIDTNAPTQVTPDVKAEELVNKPEIKKPGRPKIRR